MTVTLWLSELCGPLNVPRTLVTWSTGPTKAPCCVHHPQCSPACPRCCCCPLCCLQSPFSPWGVLAQTGVEPTLFKVLDGFEHALGIPRAPVQTVSPVPAFFSLSRSTRNLLLMPFNWLLHYNRMRAFLSFVYCYILQR